MHTDVPLSQAARSVITQTETYAAHNYHPLPVVLAAGEGAWVIDVDGRRYLDALAGYSALNFGHGNPRLLARAHEQLDRLTLTSRGFYNDQLGPFAQDLCALTGKGAVLPMNSGAEAVETALKVARKWGYRVKGVPEGQATIIVMEGNFHGRTTTIVSFSDDKVAHDDYGPYTPGFVTVPFGDAPLLREAVAGDSSVVAVLLEPIQGERGVIIPPDDYLREVREICSAAGVLMMVDEIQSGLARTGETFACDHEKVIPDVYILGKALGGGLVALSAIAADRDILDVFTPGSHGSTFGGNPYACAIGREVVAMLATGEYQAAARERGAQLAAGLTHLAGQGIAEMRVRGLWAGLDIDPGLGTGRALSAHLMRRGVLAKDTHGSTIRLAPPLCATSADIDVLVDAVAGALGDLRRP
ncbi:ornithine--oxo-acid transaminase [Nostocoides vanveenii]|uniref:ornithine aminotransferase n=1 Tax=Nostocoides vanveenii TaxID=330835 RepID=A0ABN2KX77_9MICO